MPKKSALEKSDDDIDRLLEELFSFYGECISEVPKRPNGFGFVQFANEASAKESIDGKEEKTAELGENISEEEIAEFMLDHDYIVKMRPVKEYKIRVKVVSIEKALPRIVEPEEIDEN